MIYEGMLTSIRVLYGKPLRSISFLTIIILKSFDLQSHYYSLNKLLIAIYSKRKTFLYVEMIRVTVKN